MTMTKYEIKDGDISDGDHTFGELYAHRHALFIALMNTLDEENVYSSPLKSRQHSDGTMFDGYFIAGVKLKDGWISYHLPDFYWDKLKIPETPYFPAWDGHTSDDVIARIINHFI